MTANAAMQRLAVAVLVTLACASYQPAAASVVRIVQTSNFTLPPDMDKTVWLLWFQGWNASTPWLVNKVALSWELYNPGWRIVHLDRSNLKDYLPDLKLHTAMSQQAESDMIRLSLMAKHGGVWADASMLCMEPLDRWVPEALSSGTGHWMWHAGGGKCDKPASWFQMSVRGSYMAKEWLRRAEEYWGGEPEDTKNPRGYRWMDSLFEDARQKDVAFAEAWSKVKPKLCCGDPGQAAALSDHHGSTDIDRQDRLWVDPPHALKLSVYSSSQVEGCPTGDVARTNTFQAVKSAITRLQLYDVQHSLLAVLAPELFCETGGGLTLSPGAADPRITMTGATHHHNHHTHHHQH